MDYILTGVSLAAGCPAPAHATADDIRQDSADFSPANVDAASRQSDSQTVTSLASKQSGGFDFAASAGEC